MREFGRLNCTFDFAAWLKANYLLERIFCFSTDLPDMMADKFCY